MDWRYSQGLDSRTAICQSPDGFRTWGEIFTNVDQLCQVWAITTCNPHHPAWKSDPQQRHSKWAQWQNKENRANMPCTHPNHCKSPSQSVCCAEESLGWRNSSHHWQNYNAKKLLETDSPMAEHVECSIQNAKCKTKPPPNGTSFYAVITAKASRPVCEGNVAVCDDKSLETVTTGA